ncbi:hypothetical protein LJY25_12215 [Hymenobacter sp. BT175]|uniref:hypothetical protein n=1 Tax=Hymenobacter translucens TaxID=2886507 RepID=UPI001D0E8B69|nr:hypothetical protein [Hymenobacter translucens]MCC2547214.1 hypothetical protein [Hymenobacter translucens]
MKKLFAASLLTAASLLAQHAVAQSAPAPSTEEQVKQANKAGLRKQKKASAEDIARMQQRMSMNPDEVKRDQQIEILEARAGGGTGNTSLGRAAGPARQYEKGSGGFTVRKFKDKRGTASQKRGESRPAPGINPKGKPLNHKKKRFLFF